MERQDLLGETFVLADPKSRRARTRVRNSEELEEIHDVRLEVAIAPESFAEIENEIGTVELDLVEKRLDVIVNAEELDLVPEPAERGQEIRFVLPFLRFEELGVVVLLGRRHQEIDDEKDLLPSHQTDLLNLPVKR
jgi:hypothetical protein